MELATEPVPILSRRHAAGSESARGLLFTLLGEFVLPGGGSAWTSAIIDVLGRMDIEEKTARQALMRTAGDGWMTSERVGRRTRWHLTAAAERLLIDGTERIYGFAGPAPEWDGRWLVVLARVPETDRSARHYLRTRLTWAGLGTPTPGVWVGTHTDRLGDVEGVLRQAGVFDDAQVFVAEHQGHTAIQAMVAQAWDLDEIDAAYTQFVMEFSSKERAGAGTDPLAGTVALVHAWRRFPWVDPALPAPLLPEGWTGRPAAELFSARHAALAPAARAEWERIAAE